MGLWAAVVQVRCFAGDLRSWLTWYVVGGPRPLAVVLLVTRIVTRIVSGRLLVGGSLAAGTVLTHALHGHGADPIPAASEALRGQPEPGDGSGRSRDRHAAEPLGEQPAGCLHVLDFDPDPEQVSELVDRQPRGHPGVVFAEPLHRWPLPVVLVSDLADDFLEYVLDRGQPGRAAVLIDHDGDVYPPGLHLPEQIVNRLAVRHEGSRAHHRAD